MFPIVGKWVVNEQTWVLPSYMVLLLLAVASGYFFALSQSKNFGIKTSEIEKFFLLAIPLGLGGAKIFAYAIESKPNPTFGAAGFTFYGGALTGIAYTYLFSKVRKLFFYSLLDCVTWSTLLGLAIGRVGCFLAGCCYGHVTDQPWGVLYSHPESLAFDPLIRRHPVQLYESLACFLLFTILFKFKAPKKIPGFFAMAILGGYASVRFFIEFLRGDEHRGLVASLSLSRAQIISILLIAISLIGWKQLSRRSFS